MDRRDIAGGSDTGRDSVGAGGAASPLFPHQSATHHRVKGVALIAVRPL